MKQVPYGIEDRNITQPAELLTSLSHEELEALADCLLAPAAQARLSNLLDRCREKLLAPDERAELDRLLKQSDQSMC